MSRGGGVRRREKHKQEGTKEWGGERERRVRVRVRVRE